MYSFTKTVQARNVKTLGESEVVRNQQQGRGHPAVKITHKIMTKRKTDKNFEVSSKKKVMI